MRLSHNAIFAFVPCLSMIACGGPDDEAMLVDSMDADIGAIDAGFDEMPDATPDAEPEPAVCPATTHVCIEEAPDGWSGPVRRSSAYSNEPAPACEGDFSQNVAEGGDFLEAPGRCQCGGTSLAYGVLCNPGAMRVKDSCTGSTIASASIPEGECTILPLAFKNGDFLELEPGTVTDATGSCWGGDSVDMLETAFFRRTHVLCGLEAPSTGECQDGFDCVPAEDEMGICVYREGEYDCPEAYINRDIVYQGIDDQRACAGHACDWQLPQVGDSCAGTFELGTGGSCDSANSYDADTCISNPFDGISIYLPISAEYTQSTSFLCQATGNGRTGEARAINPITVCCK